MDTSEHLARFNAQMGYIVGIIETLEENNTAILPKSDTIVVTYFDIKQFLDNKSKGPKRFIVTESENEFTIHRMIDNVDIKAIYAKIAPEPITIEDRQQKQIEMIYKTALKFATISIESAKSYCNSEYFEEFVKEKIVPYVYFQRSTSAAPLFKNDPKGATKSLQIALNKLCENGILYEIPRSAVIREFKITAKLYLIRKEI